MPGNKVSGFDTSIFDRKIQLIAFASISSLFVSSILNKMVFCILKSIFDITKPLF